MHSGPSHKSLADAATLSQISKGSRSFHHTSIFARLHARHPASVDQNEIYHNRLELGPSTNKALFYSSKLKSSLDILFLPFC
jgi:hypothetical protein